MSGEECESVEIIAEIQFNGIIRNEDGYAIGKLYDDVSFESKMVQDYKINPLGEDFSLMFTNSLQRVRKLFKM